MRKYFWIVFFFSKDGAWGFHPVSLENPDGDFLDLNSIVNCACQQYGWNAAVVINYKEITEDFFNKKIARSITALEEAQNKDV